MTDPEPINKLKLGVLLCAALALLSLIPGPRWVAAMETASFRLSLSVNGEPVRFRTVASDSGQPGLNFSLNFERRR